MDAPSRLLARRALRRGRCPSCGYDIRGLPSTTCPECGLDWSRLYETPDPGSRRIARLAAILAALLILAVAVLQQTADSTAVKAAGDPPGATALEIAPPTTQHELTARIFTKLYFYHRGSPAAAAQYAGELIKVLDSAPGEADRFRAAIIIAEVRDEEEARDRLAELEQELAPDSPLLEDIETLRDIWDGDADPARVEALVKRHGWFGRVAETYEMPMADHERRAAVGGGGKLLAAFGVFLAGGLTLGGAGFVLLIIGIVFASTGRLRPRFTPPLRGGSVAIETVAVFVAGFIGLKVVAGALEGATGDTAGAIRVALVAQWLLVALIFWPVVRGVPARRVMEMWGLHRGAGVLREIGMGIVGYIAMLPLLAVGVLTSLTLMVLYEAIRRALGHEEPIAPENPVLEMVAGASNPWLIVFLMLLASLWAPLVEECVFRGALYRYLRSSWHWLLAGVVTALGFGLMHGYPLLLLGPVISLGFGFALLREWRGSLIAPMTAHCLHNTMVILLLLFFLRVIAV